MASQNMNELGLYDIYGQTQAPFWHTMPFYTIIGLLTVGLLAMVGWYLGKKYFLKQKPKKIWEIALLQIDNLKKNNYTTVERGKEFYSALTNILKRYMHERYGFNPHEKTDQEFLRYLQEQKFSSLFMQDLATIFEGGEVIKFANASAGQQQIDRDFQTAISFIKKTIPLKAE